MENTETLIQDILTRVVECDIPVGWKSDNPLPGVGARRSTYRGEGQDFYEHDKYTSEDDPRYIDWRATAKTGGAEPVKVMFQEERDVKCYVLVDISSSMEFGTHRVTKRLLAAELAASIMVSVDQTRDKCGLVVYSSNRVEDELPAKSVHTNLFPALTAILETKRQAGPVTGEKPGDGLAKALSALPLRRSLVFVVSDFLNMSGADWTALLEAGVMHDVIAIFVQDKRERELPVVPWPGCLYVLEDYGGARKFIWNNGKTRAQYATNFKQRESSILKQLDDCHTQFLVVSTEEGDAALPKIMQLFMFHE